MTSTTGNVTIPISLASWEELSEEQRSALISRRNAPIHLVERGAIVSQLEQPGLVFAVVENKSGYHVGIVRWSPPFERADAAWWIDSDYRNASYGTEAVKLLAAHMLTQGVTGACVRIDAVSPEHQQASWKLKELFESMFPNGCPDRVDTHR